MRLNPPIRTQLNFDGENATYNYVGESPVGASISGTCWRIYRLENVGTGSIIKRWADKSDLYNKVWDDRTSYVY